ncbi:hypothetical protein YW3DRAFT_07104 [Streptomyces sp. MnatMP-M77]|nr:hypothetical protein [Streptomyces sp. MnatMP-M77]SBV03720.1 hypothetical protein YW3DRAFT_07104 [Streptomyces sp. MnatMP-M77]
MPGPEAGSPVAGPPKRKWWGAAYLAEQLDIADASVLKAYADRENTRLDHVRELRRVLLPGLMTMARLVALVRQAANQRLWGTLHGLLSTGQRAVLDSLLTLPVGARVSELDRLRRGNVRISGPQMRWALERAEEIAGLGMGELDVSGIPPRRLAEPVQYRVDGKASLLRWHSDARRLATLLATTVYLTSRAVDDAVDLLEVLIATKLLAHAERDSAKEKLKTLPQVERGPR